MLADAVLGLGALVLAGGLGLALLLALTVRRRRTLGSSGEIAAAELARALSVVGPALAPATTLAELERRLHGRYGAGASGYASLLRARRYGRESDSRSAVGRRPTPAAARARRPARSVDAPAPAVRASAGAHRA